MTNVEDTRPHIDQCEGCYGPLGSLLDAGKEMSDFRITWYHCPSHQPQYDGNGEYYDFINHEEGY